MKKITSIFFIFVFIFILASCGKKNEKTKEEKLYFDCTGIAEVSHIAYTSEDTFDLKTIFKVGDRLSMYNDRKIGVTTYDDIMFYIYESYGQTEYQTENDEVKINSDGTVTRKKLCTAVIYAKLKDESGIDPEELDNSGMHVLTLFFGNEQTFGTWEAENTYLDIWIEDKIANGETDAKKGTMTLVFNSDFTYTLTVTKGYWGTSSIDENIEKDEVITGKLVGLCSSGALRYDDNQDEIRYDFIMEMNKYGMSYEETYTLFTGYTSNPESRTWRNYRFLPKETNTNTGE